jgi:hypothetical protein
MATAARKPVSRSYRILSPIQADGTGSIQIRCGKVVEAYDLTVYPAYDGTATGVCLTKADGTRYEACLSAEPTERNCSCKGHTYHKEGKDCKHLGALTDMRAKDNLPLPILTADATSDYPEDFGINAPEELEWSAYEQIAA